MVRTASTGSRSASSAMSARRLDYIIGTWSDTELNLLTGGGVRAPTSSTTARTRTTTTTSQRTSRRLDSVSASTPRLSVGSARRWSCSGADEAHREARGRHKMAAGLREQALSGAVLLASEARGSIRRSSRK